MKKILMRPLLAGTALTFLLSTLSSVLGQSSIDHVVIVLDASGSMKQKMPGSNQNKMDAAKDALIEVLSTIPQSTHVGLVVFSAANIKDHWVFPLGKRDDNTLLPAIKSINPNRGTPLGKYIKIGADRLLEERKAQFGYGTYRLLIVTDGEANDRDLVEKHTPEVLSRGLRVDVIGVAMKQDHTLATKVHTYRRANDASTLKQAIAEVFAEVGSQQGNLAGEDAFDILDPLPVEFASTAIASLSNSGNEPIGSASKSNRRSNNQREQTNRMPNSQHQPDSVTIEKSGST
jgi:hypothetical protein